MNYVLYKKTSHGYGLSNLASDGGDRLTLVFPGVISGFVRLGDRVFRLLEGTAEIEPAALPDGEYEPTLICDGSPYPLPQISVCGGVARLSESNAKALARRAEAERILALRIEELEAKLVELTARIYK